jgi:hypothetical protein
MLTAHSASLLLAWRGWPLIDLREVDLVRDSRGKIVIRFLEAIKLSAQNPDLELAGE